MVTGGSSQFVAATTASGKSYFLILAKEAFFCMIPARICFSGVFHIGGSFSCRQTFQVKEGTCAVKDEVSHTARARSWWRDAEEMRSAAAKLEKKGEYHEARMLKAAAGWYELGARMTPGASR